MQHICTETHDFDFTNKHRRHSGRRTKSPAVGPPILAVGPPFTHNTGRTAHSGGRTAPPELNQKSSLENPKPSGIFNRIELLTGGSKNYETKCSRITLPSYTLYFWPRANLTKIKVPVRPPANGRSDRQHPNQNALGGLTATMAGQTASYLTAAQTFRKRVFSQTNNAIANCHIILRSCAYPHDIHNLPLDEHIGN